MNSIRFSLVLQLCLSIFVAAGCFTASSQTVTGNRQVLSLGDCLHIAMERNHGRAASRFAVAMSEAQHRQALAAHWPQVSAQGGVNRMIEAPNFIYPASTMYIPAQSVSIPCGTATVTIPANAFGPGFPPAAIQMPVSSPRANRYHRHADVSHSGTEHEALEPHDGIGLGRFQMASFSMAACGRDTGSSPWAR